MATDVSQVLTSLGQNLAEDAMSAVNPAISSVIGDMLGNPKDWNDPATAVIKGAAAVATIVAGITNPLEVAAVAGAAQLVSSLWQMLKPHLESTKPVAPATASVPQTVVVPLTPQQTLPQNQPAAVPAAVSQVDPTSNGLTDASHM